MKKKILVLSIYPAPYRLEACKNLKDLFQADVFFESRNGDKRDDRWFQSGDYHTLDSAEGRRLYRDFYKNLSQYDLVVLYDYGTKEGRRLIWKCRRKKIPYVVNCDGMILPRKKSFLKDLVKKWLLSKASAYLASGQHAKEYFLRYGAKEEKIHIHKFSALHEDEILKAPTNEEEKKRLREKLGLPLDKKIVIAVGRFIPLKRYDYLLKVWSKLDENHCLLLIGGGSEYAQYREIINDKNLKNVILEGFHSPQELYEYYKAADLFVHPSTYDVWGLVINEAMANGLPVVVSNTCVAGLELIKEGKNGYLFPMGEENAAIDKVSLILRDEELQRDMSLEGIKTIQGYTVEDMAKTHMSVFERVLKEYEE